MTVVINTINDQIVNKEFATLKEATDFLKPYFEKTEEITPPQPPQE